MRRAVIGAAAAAAIVAGTASAGIARARISAPTATPSLQRSAHVIQVYGTGPSAKYGGDTGIIGVITPLSFTLPSGPHAYTATITISFQYRTTGQALFYLAPALRAGGASRQVVAPQLRNLTASKHPTSTTELFRANLKPGVRYALSVDANLNRTYQPPVSITTRRMLVEVEAWPAP